MKKIILLLFALCMIPLALGYVPITDYHGEDNTRGNIGQGDVIFTTYNETLITFNDSVYSNGFEPMISNFIDGNGELEIVTHGSCGFQISYLNGTRINNLSLCGVADDINGVVAHDWDNDGNYEIFLSYYDSTRGYVRVYDFSSGGAITQIFADNTSAPTQGRVPKCHNPYCVINDINNNLYRWTESTGSKSQLNYGSLVGDTDTIPITIDECNLDNVGYEVMVYGDLDGDNFRDDIAMIDLNSMTVVHTQNNAVATNYEIGRPVTCAPVDNDLRVWVQGYDGNHYPSGFSTCNCQTYWTTRMFNWSLSYLNEASYFLHTTTNGLLNGNCPPSQASTCNNGGYGTAPTTPVSVLPTQSPNYVCWGLDYYVGSDYVRCFNGSLSNVISSVALTNGVGHYNGLSPLNGITGLFDVNNDGIDDIVTPEGDMVKQTGGTISVIGYLPSVGNYWNTFKDDDTYADYIGGTGINYNLYSDNIGAVNGTGNATAPNVTVTNVFFNETFTTGSFFQTNSDCVWGNETGGGGWSIGNNLTLDETWTCYIENESAQITTWEEISSTTYIDTANGLNFTIDEIGGGQTPNIVSMVAPYINPDIDFDPEDMISFSCHLNLVSPSTYVYLEFVDQQEDDFNYISLKNGGCSRNSSLPYSAYGTPSPITTNCCEMNTIWGMTCLNAKTSVATNYSDMLSACDDFVDLTWQDIDRIGVVVYKENTNDEDIYVDDIFVAQTPTSPADQIPNIIDINAVPDPQEVTQNVAWGVTITDDGLASQVYSGFDCDDSVGGIDYPLTIRGTTVPVFNCTYSSVGTYTGRAFASDTANYPDTVNDTETVEIIDSGIPAYVNCTGFIDPTCIGDCYFHDDFDYNYSILCHDWLGTNRTPVDDTLWLYDLDFGSQLYLNKVGTPISMNDYATFEVEFDFMDNSGTYSYFQIYDSSIYHLSLNLQFTGSSIYAYDDVPPFNEFIGTYNQGETYHLKATVNFNAQTITWDFSGNNATVQTDIADNQVEDAGYFSFDWVTASALNLTLDNFTISHGINQTLNISDDEYEIGLNDTSPTYLTTGHFCGINWTQKRFIEQDCIDRGYNYPEGLEQVCMMRACVSDTFTWMYYRALQNIFKTLIIVVALLLVAPLFIAFLGKIKK